MYFLPKLLIAAILVSAGAVVVFVYCETRRSKGDEVE
jgi:hypothetical protein